MEEPHHGLGVLQVGYEMDSEKGERASLWLDTWLLNNETLRECINGPLTLGEVNIKASDLIINHGQ